MVLRSIISEVSGLQFIIEDLSIQSSVGKRFLLDSEMMHAEIEILNELDLLENIIKLLNTEKDVEIIDKIHFKLGQLKDIQGTFKNLKKNVILEDVDFFEIKKFSMLTEEIIELQQKLSETKLPSIPSLLNCKNILDPDKTNIASFYIYDSYSEKLKEVRVELKKVKNNIDIDDFEKNKASTLLYNQLDSIELEIRSKLGEQLKNEHQNLDEALNKLAHLDVLIAKAIQAKNRKFCKPFISENITEYQQLFNPYFQHLLELNNKKFQPVDISLNNSVCFITGANMSGKTVLLKSIALCQYMFQFGFLIPAQKAEINIVDKILVSFGAEQHEKNGLSSFASEILLVNEMIIDVLNGNNPLLLIDELARTTNPIEGKAIVNAVGKILQNKNVKSLITTHYSGIDNQFRKLRVKGLKQNIDVTLVNRNNMNDFIDYSLIEDESDKMPQEALLISEILGVHPEIISNIKIELKKE